MKDKLFLLDAYALIYRAYYALIKSPRINSKGQNTSAILGFVNTLLEILTKESPTHIGVAFDPKGGTFRHELFKEYKAQREETPEVIRESVPVIKEIISAFNIPILEVPGFEADDVIGTLSKQADEKGIRTYMLTPDKDYCQLVTENALLFKPKFGESGYDTLDPQAVLEKYGLKSTDQIRDLLGLMGDSADNIPGCPGIGPKTAQKLLAEYGSVEAILAATDTMKGAVREKLENNAEKITFSKLLATIRTDVPIVLDMEDLEVKKPDISRLKEILEGLEMRGLLKRILQEYGKDDIGATVKSDGFGGNLFAEFAGDGTDEEKNPILSEVKPLDFTTHIIDNENDMTLQKTGIKDAEKIAICVDIAPGQSISAEITGIAIACDENEGWYVPIYTNRAEERIPSAVIDILENEAVCKIGYNLKSAILALTAAGMKLEGELFDTMVAHYVIQPEQNHSLGHLSETLLGIMCETSEEKQTQGELFFQPDTDAQAQESCRKAILNLKMKTVLEKALAEDNTTELFRNVEMPLVRVLAEMEMNGVRIDPDALKESSRIFTERLQAIEHEIFEEVGFTFNILSPKQVGEVLFDKLKLSDKAKKTKNGQYVTSEEVLEGIRDKSPVVGKILQYRGLKKLIGTYIDTLPTLINPRTGKIHTSFNQTVTATGRLSSSGPNLQNIPVRDEDGKEVRKAFIPDPGCKFFSADYSQIELRIMAHLSQDSNMIEDFGKGEDIHAATAAKIFHKKVEDVTREERSKAKTANFGIIYGISPFGLAERMKVSRTEAKELIDNYFITYPGIRSYIERQIQKARENGYIETMMHRKRYLPDISSHNATVRGYAERNAVNAPIQGSAADIIKIAMVKIRDEFKRAGLKSAMILQVHDELNFNVVPGEEEIVERIVTTQMQEAFKMSVNLTADCGWGANWLEAH